MRKPHKKKGKKASEKRYHPTIKIQRERRSGWNSTEMGGKKRGKPEKSHLDP